MEPILKNVTYVCFAHVAPIYIIMTVLNECFNGLVHKTKKSVFKNHVLASMNSCMEYGSSTVTSAKVCETCIVLQDRPAC